MSRNARCSVPQRVDRHQQRGHDAGQRDAAQVRLGVARRQQVEEQHQAGGAQHDERGQQAPRGRRRGKHDLGRHRSSATLALLCTWAISAAIVASVLPVNADGYTPIHTMKHQQRQQHRPLARR